MCAEPILRFRLESEAVRSRRRPGPIEARNFDDRIAARQAVVDHDLGLDRECAAPHVSHVLVRREFRRADFSPQGSFDVCGDATGRGAVRPRRCSKARETKIVSSASPSVVVKIWASTILPPAAAQAPAMPVSSLGWSGATTVTAVTPRKPSVVTSVASERMSAAIACSSLACATWRGEIDLQPVSGIMALGVGLELGV